MGHAVTELTLTQKGESSVELSQKTGRRVFRVLFDADTPPANLVAVENASGLPDVGDEYPGDDTRYAKRKGVKALGDGLLFEVTVEYDDELIVFGEDPLEDPDIIEWPSIEGTEAWFIDKSETPKPRVNTAGQPFEHFGERDAGDIFVVVTRNLESFPVATAIAYRNAVNTDAFTLDGASIGVGEAKMGMMTGSAKQVRNGIEYVVVKYPMKLRADWDDKIGSYGFQELVSGKLKDIVKGTPPTKVDKPWPLNENGTKKTNSTDAPFEIVFKPFPRLSFATFSFA